MTKDGALVANAAATWADVNPALPAQDILMFIPGTKHGTREVFDTKVIVQGCKDTGAHDLFLAVAEGADDKEKASNADKACNALRTDGKSVDIDGDYTETLSRLDANKTAIGVFGLSFYENNMDKLKVATMGGVVPSVDTICQGRIPGVASALLLRQEGPYRRDPRPEGICRVLRERRHGWPGRPAGGLWSGSRSGTGRDPSCRCGRNPDGSAGISPLA